MKIIIRNGRNKGATMVNVFDLHHVSTTNDHADCHQKQGATHRYSVRRLDIPQ